MKLLNVVIKTDIFRISDCRYFSEILANACELSETGTLLRTQILTPRFARRRARASACLAK